MDNVNIPPSRLKHLNGTSDIYSYLNGEDGQSLMDEITEDVWDKEAANVTVYVDLAGNDVTGDGTVGSPYATIARAFKDVPIRSEYQRTIQLGAGSFTFPSNWTNAFVGNGHYIKGTTSVGSAHTISSINTSSRDNGLILSVAPDPGWALNSLVGQHIKFTSGSLNNTYGVIYENTSDTIYVSNAKSGAWVNPAPADTFAFHTLDSTIDNNVTSPDRIGVQFDYLIMQDLNFTGGYFGVGYSTFGSVRCNFNIEQNAIGAYTRGVFWTCYLAENNTLSNVMTVGDQCRFELDYGSVVDGQARTKGLLFAGAYLTLGHDVVFSNLDANGIQLQGFNGVYKNSASDNLTLRFHSCSSGFVAPADTSDITIQLPYLAGNITGSWLGYFLGKNIEMTFDGGTVSTGGNDNACTVNGTSESYVEDSRNVTIYDNTEVGYIERNDVATAAVDLYVDAAGNDTTGNGTAAYPYLTIDRAFRDVPINMEQQRNIYLSAGTFNWNNHYTLGFKQARINFYGTTSVDNNWTISSINTSSRDNGLQLTVDAGMTPGEHIGKTVLFTSGNLNGKYGVIYDNDATDIWCTSEDSSGAWVNPIATDTVDLISNDSTIDIDGGRRNSIRVMRFYNINFTGGWFQGAMSALTYWYCTCNWTKLTAGPDSVHRGLATYFTCSAGSIVAEVGRDATIRLNRGCVVDGASSGKIEILSAGSIALQNETVFTRIPTGGITMNTDSRITSDEYSATGNTLRFYNEAAGFTVNAGAAGGQVNLPYITGTITDDFLIDNQGTNYKGNLDGGTVTTNLGTNICSWDNTNEGYLDLENGNEIVGIEVKGERDTYLQTSDATITDIATIDVAEGDVFQVEAYVLGRKSDGTDRAIYHLEGCFYRNAAGNVTQQGATTVITSLESNVAWNCTLNADAGNQTIDVRVTGVAATTINWKAIVKYIKTT